MWLILIPLLVCAIVLAAIGFDSYFLHGKYLNRLPVTETQLKQSLQAVLAQEDRAFEEWDPIPQDWVTDKMNIPIADARLDSLRLQAVRAIGDSNSFQRLSAKAKAQIQEILNSMK